ncbi:undecaprenyl-phosphate galactose phosphotransferase WbaP [Rosenbergiella australiborealis]|uniref:undecaprenyl-phosphate galactose phosphotransferase WbaP n=1 Tax=Rosenbergiella australiborealis TaxID=1544696 RepID=UPI001F4F01E1|nr:undecaprenyl-phosphate galactose phosphotransferase WbaP [Rosenbergiella australiborealis]
MLRVKRNFFVSNCLILSDAIGFILPIFLLLSININILNDSIIIWYKIHGTITILALLWFGGRLRHYYHRKTFWYELKEIVRTIFIFSIIEVTIIFFSNWQFSRYILLINWVGILILVPSLRFSAKALLFYLGFWQRDALIIGTGKNAIDAYTAIRNEKNLGLNIIGFVLEDKSKKSANKYLVDNIKIIENPIIEIIKKVDKKLHIIIALENEDQNVGNDWLRLLMQKGFRYISLIPTLRGMPVDSTDVSFIFSHEVLIFRVQQKLARSSSKYLKRAFDIIISSVLIFILIPVFAYLSLKVKKDGGEVFYGHERIGRNGRVFKCLKFRSMAIDSKELLKKLLDEDPIAKKEWEDSYKLKNDPRVTPIGHFLRRTSLDELPQLFNVLKGEMSLVGPRPIIEEELSRYNEQVDYYLMSKPGMTGLWQVSGRSNVDYETRVYFDTWYVKNWSMWNDIAILFKTVSVVMKRDGAY